MTLLSMVFILISCGFNPGGKVNSGRSKSKLYQSFFVGEEGTQYFIDRILFENRKSENYLFADFTFRHSNTKRSSVTFNFSLNSKVYVSQMDSLALLADESVFMAENIKIMFTEKQDGRFVSRFTSSISLDHLKQLMKAPEPKIRLFYKGSDGSQALEPHPKTFKKIQRLNEDLFFIF